MAKISASDGSTPVVKEMFEALKQLNLKKIKPVAPDNTSSEVYQFFEEKYSRQLKIFPKYTEAAGPWKMLLELLLQSLQ